MVLPEDFGAEDLDDAPAGNPTAQASRSEGNAPSWECRQSMSIGLTSPAQLHDGALTELALDLSDGHVHRVRSRSVAVSSSPERRERKPGRLPIPELPNSL